MPSQPISEPFGTILGYAPGGVPAYSSNYDTVDEREYPTRHSYRSYYDGVYMGYKWQCVEFARRWLYVNRGYVFDDVAMAYEIFHLSKARHVKTHQPLPLYSFANGSKRPPEPGCLLIWNESGHFSHTGHVAIVTEVFPDRLRVAEQNLDHEKWPEGCTYSRELPARRTDTGCYWVRCSMHDSEILGWVIQTDDASHAEPRREFDPRLMSLEMKSLEEPTASQKAWLNEANPPEAAYVKAVGGHWLARDPELRTRVMEMSETLEDLVKRVTNDAHALFLHATDYVLQDESRLAPFNIPQAIWPRILNSWNNRKNEMITGRFDLAVRDSQVKVYEYNCDSATCHMETAIVQEKWARYARCKIGRSAGALLYDRLVEAWQSIKTTDTVHLLYDRNLEETYHTLFMREVMEAAGITTKVLDRLDGLVWGESGEILDPDGVPIHRVWKTWAWETALDQIRVECEEDEERLKRYRPGVNRTSCPRLADLLLRPHVMVYEPLWTLIPSNKAILPILWKLFPNHPILLESHYELTPSLQKGGYVCKPIVGRGGANIALVDRHSHSLGRTAGAFGKRSCIYQELFALPQLEEFHVQVGSLTVGGQYAGSCVRLDRSPIIQSESDIIALRVVKDQELIV